MVTRFRSTGPEGKPHSTKEGRSAEAQRAYIRKFGPQEPRRKRIWPKRAKHGLGGAIKKIIQKVVKPKGVFKPKPVPKSVTDKPTGWSPKGEYTKADDNKINSMLKKLGDEIKAQPLPPKTKELVKKLQKAYPHHDSAGRNKASKKMFKSAKGKAEGGRIGLSHGGSVGAAIRGRGAEIK